MDQRVQEFQIKTQQKVIDHYLRLLRSPGLREHERDAINAKLTHAENEIQRLVLPFAAAA